MTDSKQSEIPLAFVDAILYLLLCHLHRRSFPNCRYFVVINTFGTQQNNDNLGRNLCHTFSNYTESLTVHVRVACLLFAIGISHLRQAPLPAHTNTTVLQPLALRFPRPITDFWLVRLSTNETMAFSWQLSAVAGGQGTVEASSLTVRQWASALPQLWLCSHHATVT